MGEGSMALLQMAFLRRGVEQRGGHRTGFCESWKMAMEGEGEQSGAKRRAGPGTQ